jgi:uncharacterized protein (TIGR02145 family)
MDKGQLKMQSIAREYNIWLVVVAFTVCMLIFGVLVTVAPYVTESVEADPDASVPASTPTLTISTGLTDTDSDTIPDLNLAAINPTATGSVVSGSMTLGVKTNSPEGYNLKLRAGSANMTNGANNIAPTAGSVASPAPLSANSWGFAIPKTQTHATGLIATGFDNTYVAENNNQSSTSKWAPVPTSDTTIKTTTTANDAGDGDTTTVFYGVKATLALPAGAYKANVVYTAVVNDVPTPIITGVSPTQGNTAGGYSMNIYGSNFYDQTAVVKVTIGGVECTDYDVKGPGQINCLNVPPHSAGVVDIKVTTIQGGTGTLAGGFTYANPAPTISSVSPNSGHFRGGETITLTGTGFTGATAVMVNSVNCRSFAVVNDTTATCVTPGIGATYQDGVNSTMTNPTNTVGVSVTAATGTGTSANSFTYRYINKSFTTAGSYMDIRGTDIALGSKIYVNGVECTNRKITSSTTAACTTPATTTGNQTVTIVAPPASQGNMQNWAGCSAISTPVYTTTDWAPYTRVLTDTRNNQNYRIRKLPDGNCWMIDNLKLANYTLTATDSDVTANFTIPASPVQNSATHGNGVCVGGTASTTGSYLTCDGTSTQSTTNTPFIAYSDPSGTENSYADNCTNQNGISENSLTGCGYLYNWYTATAGTGTYSTSSGAVASSICPAGWNLPVGYSPSSSGNQFAILNNAMATGSTSASTTNSATTRPNWRYNGPFEGSLSGYYYSGISNAGNNGYYWSSSAYSSTYAYYLYFNYSNVDPGINSLSKYYGFAVRCVLV